MSRDGIIFYESFYQAVRGLNADDFKECITAVMEYGLYGHEVEMSSVARMFFTMAKPQIDANNKRYENGKKGGRKPKPKEQEDNHADAELKPKHNRIKTKTEPKPTETTEPVLVQGELYPQLAARSIYAPNIEDVKEFAALKGLNINVEEFYHHYDAINWRLGGQNADWRKLAMSWGAGRKEKQQPRKIQNTVTGSVFADAMLRDGEKNGN